MAKKITNKAKIEEAKKLLKEVMISEYGEQPPKYINFEFLSSVQVEKRDINPNQITISTTNKYGREFVTLKACIVTDK